MAIQYDFYESPSANGDEKKKYHARFVPQGTLTTTEMAKYLQLSSSVTEGDVKGILVNLVEKMKVELGNSWQIHIEGLGYFQLTLVNPPANSPHEKRAESVKVRSVSFRPEKEFMRHFLGAIPERVATKVHSAQHTEAEIDGLLVDYFAKQPYLTAGRFRSLCGLTRTTATRRLKQWLDVGKLNKVYQYGQPLYEKGEALGSPDTQG